MVWYSRILTSHATHYRSFWRRFYGSDDPTNSVIALTMVKGQSHQTLLTDQLKKLNSADDESVDWLSSNSLEFSA